MKKLFAVLIFCIVSIYSFTACMPPIPQTVDLTKYFHENATVYVFSIDDEDEKGYKLNDGNSIALSKFIDNEDNIELNKYGKFHFGFNEKIKELKINGVYFTIKADQDCTLRVNLKMPSDEQVKGMDVNLTANQKKEISFKFESYTISENDERYSIGTGSIIYSPIDIELLNILEVIDVKWSLDYLIFDAEVIE